MGTAAAVSFLVICFVSLLGLVISHAVMTVWLIGHGYVSFWTLTSLSDFTHAFNKWAREYGASATAYTRVRNMLLVTCLGAALLMALVALLLNL